MSASREQFIEFIGKEPYIAESFALAPEVGTPGYTLPPLEDMRVFEAGASSVTALAEKGISLAAPHGSGNHIFLYGNMPKLDLRVSFHGRSSFSITIGSSVSFSGSLSVEGDCNAIIFSGVAGHQGRPNVKVNVACSHGLVFFGRDFTSVGSHWLLEGDGRKMVIGDDCMLSWEIFVRNYDSHAIFDVETLDIINLPKDVRIGPHCWIGQRAAITKGVRIGYGSIIAIASVVTSDLPEFCAAAGVPARVLRTGVTWSRARNPDVSMRSIVAMSLSHLGI